MTFLELVKKRRSIRSYTDQKISRKDLELCVEAARYAPSACDCQPWSFIIIDDPGKKGAVSKAVSSEFMRLNTFAGEASAFIAIVSEKQKLPAWLGGKIRNVDFRHIDIGVACEHLVLQAEELGIGTCILGWFSERQLKKILSVPFYKKIELVLAMGYPGGAELSEKELKKKSKVLFYNKYRP